MHQLTRSHFQKMHTFRLEWQPGPGGRLDWFTKDYKVNSTFSMTGDGMGQDWVHAFSIKDESLSLTGAQIPIEPSYLIMNTGISSTWGFPYDVPSSCTTCYDCNNATCACNFHPGFCNMMKSNDVAMYIDHIRVYQSKNHSAHVGHPHSLGCDPIEYPTREYIKGHEYTYMRSPPFVYDDKGPLATKIKNGGGSCKAHSDCGGVSTGKSVISSSIDEEIGGHGKCVEGHFSQGFFGGASHSSRCICNRGYTGPMCLSLDKKDDFPGAFELRTNTEIFRNLPSPEMPSLLVTTILGLTLTMVIVACRKVNSDYEQIGSGTSYKKVNTNQR